MDFPFETSFPATLKVTVYSHLTQNNLLLTFSVESFKNCLEKKVLKGINNSGRGHYLRIILYLKSHYVRVHCSYLFPVCIERQILYMHLLDLCEKPILLLNRHQGSLQEQFFRNAFSLLARWSPS